MGERKRDELADLLGVKVARHADDALGADGHEGQGEAVITAEHRDVAAQGGDDLVDAIHAATTQWMTWKINRHTTKDYGIPRGLPYLTGFVIHCEIAEESLAA